MSNKYTQNISSLTLYEKLLGGLPSGRGRQAPESIVQQITNIVTFMKRVLSLLLRFITLVALYVIIGYTFGMHNYFSFLRIILMGCVFSGFMLGMSELLQWKKK